MDQKMWKESIRRDERWFKLQRMAQAHFGRKIEWRKAPAAKPRTITAQQAHDSTRAKRARQDRAEKLVMQ